MITCPSCKTDIESDSWYCDQCGLEIKYCNSCGKMGKGNRCTSCGDQMVPARLHSKNVNSTVLIQKDISVTSVAASDKTVRVHREIKLYLVNYPLGIRLEASNNAIIGRRQGPYISVLNSQPYISSKHAVLKCDMGAEWSITDLGSSNGTFLDRVKLVPDIPYQLKPGMKVQLANVELVVEIE